MDVTPRKRFPEVDEEIQFLCFSLLEAERSRNFYNFLSELLGKSEELVSLWFQRKTSISDFRYTCRVHCQSFDHCSRAISTALIDRSWFVPQRLNKCGLAAIVHLFVSRTVAAFFCGCLQASQSIYEVHYFQQRGHVTFFKRRWKKGSRPNLFGKQELVQDPTA